MYLKLSIYRNKILTFAIILVVLFLFGHNPSLAYAQERTSTNTSILVIQQIRGNETCCLSGTTEIIEHLTKEKDIWDLSLAWAVRFDVLKDQSFVDTIKTVPRHHTLGLLLEITPQLASESGVTYQGDLGGKDWKEGQHALTIGYTQEERKKLLDTAFSLFHARFGHYPMFTVGWMIDSWSLNYIRDTYGVRIHEITKEQYETDSYTLYGGIFNLPYFPTRLHPLIPAQDEGNALDLLIVRQTISDITKNYGSYFSWYTSQPNDYLSRPSTDFSYFNELLGKTMHQDTESRFAVLGLENSNEWVTHKDEYLKQLHFIVEKQKNNEMKVIAPSDFYQTYKDKNNLGSPRILESGTISDSGVWWYFGPVYRARIEVVNANVLLTDLRIFPPTLTDPYFSDPSSASRSYWILPYLIDSSQQFFHHGKDQSIFQGHPIRTDEGVERFTIQLLSDVTEMTKENGQLVFKGKEGIVRLEPQHITIEQFTPRLGAQINKSFDTMLAQKNTSYITFDRHPRFFIRPSVSELAVMMGWENASGNQTEMARMIKTATGWQLAPRSTIPQADVNSLHALFQPDRSSLPIDLKHTILYWHNTEAIVGRGPIRLYVDPRNMHDRPVRVGQFEVQLFDSSTIKVNMPHSVETRIEPFFVDFTATDTQKANLQINIGNEIVPQMYTIRFYADCTQHFVECMKDQERLIGFMRIYIREITDGYKEKMKNWWTKLVNDFQLIKYRH